VSLESNTEAKFHGSAVEKSECESMLAGMSLEELKMKKTKCYQNASDMVPMWFYCHSSTLDCNYKGDSIDSDQDKHDEAFGCLFHQTLDFLAYHKKLSEQSRAFLEDPFKFCYRPRQECGRKAAHPNEDYYIDGVDSGCLYHQTYNFTTPHMDHVSLYVTARENEETQANVDYYHEHMKQFFNAKSHAFIKQTLPSQSGLEKNASVPEKADTKNLVGCGNVRTTLKWFWCGSAPKICTYMGDGKTPDEHDQDFYFGCLYHKLLDYQDQYKMLLDGRCEQFGWDRKKLVLRVHFYRELINRFHINKAIQTRKNIMGVC